MAKRVLISKLDARGDANSGYLVVDVVNTQADEFEVASDLEWKACSDDNVKAGEYWFDPSDNSIRILPNPINQVSDAGALNTDSDGNVTEAYVWDWSTDSWTKQNLES